jgi:biopolymer transport protein ExbD
MDEMNRRLVGRMGGQTGFDEPTPSMAPLIDVSFLLLIFFIVTMTILARERDLGIAMPPEEQGEVHPVLPIVVGVEGDGSIVLNPGIGELLVSSDVGERSLPILEKHVEMLRSSAGEREVVVQLRVEEEAYQQRVVDVLNCFAKVGVTTVALVDVQ